MEAMKEIDKSEFHSFLKDIKSKIYSAKSKIYSAKSKAILSANRLMIELYLEIDKDVK
jgi:hypothetical protein